MGIQMNIKSAEAKALAEKIAKAKGVSVTQAVVESLRVADKALSKQDKATWLAGFLAESQRLNAGYEKDLDHTAFLYDDRSLPI